MDDFITEEQLVVYIITSRLNNGHYGMLATWISPASLRKDELRFTFALSKFNNSAKAILTSREFVIHKLQKEDYLTAFKMGFYHSESHDKFDKLKYVQHQSGIRVLENAASFAYSNVLSQIETEDRFILYCSIKNVRVIQKSKEVLTQGGLFSQLSETCRSQLSQKYIQDCERDTPSK